MHKLWQWKIGLLLLAAATTVVPTPDHVRSGHYPLVKTLYFVFAPDQLAPGTQAFLDFMSSPEATDRLAAHGSSPETKP